jgi:hypothetical protein
LKDSENVDQFIAEGNFMESILVEMEEAPVISENDINNWEVLKPDHVQPDSFNESVDSNPEFDNWKKYPCLGCPEVFTSECNLQLHMDFDHEVKNLNLSLFNFYIVNALGQKLANSESCPILRLL